MTEPLPEATPVATSPDVTTAPAPRRRSRVTMASVFAVLALLVVAVLFRGRQASTSHYIGLSMILFVIGTFGVLIRRNTLVLFMCIELMLNAVNIAFVAFSRM